MAWNDERVELLKKLWADGLSASQIAGRLGGVTRNAVIGKVHRLGLSGRATTSRMKSHRPRARSQTARRLMKPRFANIGNPALRQLYLGDAEPYMPPAEELVIPLNERRSIQTLTETCCRWPIGDPQIGRFPLLRPQEDNRPALLRISTRGALSSRRSRAAATARFSLPAQSSSFRACRVRPPSRRRQAASGPAEKAAV